MKSPLIRKHIVMFGIFLCFAIVHVASVHADNQHWLNVALPGIPATFVPADINDVVSITVIHNNVFEALAKFGEGDASVQPLLATSWETKDSGKTWIFNLRENVYFHDGSILTAEDVVDCLGKNIYFTGKIEKSGDLQVKITLPEERVEFVETMTLSNFSVMKKLENGSLIGTGPYVLASTTPSSRIDVTAFEGYWDGKPALEGISYHCSLKEDDAIDKICSGEIDVMHVVPPNHIDRIEMDENVLLNVIEGVNVGYITINVSRPPLDQPDFRHALNMLINRENIINKVFSGQAIECKGLVPPVIGGKSKGSSRVKYDPVSARKIISNHIVDEGRVFRMVGLPFVRSYCPEPNRVARLIAGYMKGVGLRFEYIPTNSMVEYFEQIAGNNYDFIVDGYVIDSPNKDDFYTYVFGVGVDSQYSIRWRNEEFDSLVREARSVVSEKAREELYDRADDIFFEEYPWIILVHSNDLAAYRKEVEGVVFIPTGELRLGKAWKNHQH